jgi:hypothetical protein
MSTIGRNGRFGNQLFQYLFLRLCAEVRGAKLQTVPWVGQGIFGFNDPPVTWLSETLVTSKEIGENPLEFLRGDPRLDGDMELMGWFNFHTSHYRPYRDFIRRLFTFAPAFRDRFKPVVAQMRATGRPIVALHLRRGDYGYEHFFRAPALWYDKWLGGPAVGKLRNPLIYICSDTIQEVAPHFSRWNILHAGLIDNLPPEMAYLIDFHLMVNADALAISNSSFSFMAAMLNNRARLFVRPTLEHHRLVPFDPWNAQPVLQRELKPGEQEGLDALDRPA